MLAIIPARGGSKGLPGKNTRSLGGLPLIAHSIISALESSSVSRVIVSTDSHEIGNLAKEYGAEVPFLRPEYLASDTSMVMDTYFHICDYIEETTEIPVEQFIALLPTSPFRTPTDIDEAVRIFESKKADSVISVTAADVPVQWYRKISEDGILKEYLDNFNAVKNRQELQQSYIPNGSIYIFRTRVLREHRDYYTGKTYPYIMPKERSIDIDSEIDFIIAEYLVSKK